VLAEEDDVTLFEPKIVERLNAAREHGDGYHGWLTATKIANGIGQRKAVEAALAGAQHLFVVREGQEAKALGAKANSKLWGLKSWDEELEEAEPETPAPAVEPELELELEPSDPSDADELGWR